MTKISVITATLGRASLKDTCASIDAQTLPDWHHYVLGDGVLPTDYSHPQRTTMGFTQPLGKYEPSQDKPSGTPNPIFRWAIDHLGLNECLCFLDDDNAYRQDFLEVMYKALKESSVGIAICALENCRSEDLHDGYPELGRCDTSGFLVYSHVAKEIGFPFVVEGEDNIEDFRFIKACADLHGWVRVPQKLVYFGLNPRSIPQNRVVRRVDAD